MMKSVDKLRDCTWIGSSKVNEYLDEIEREIAEHYMELPLDADGVPIRAGDIMKRVDGGPSQQACCICSGGFNDAPIWCARDFRHVKPRTLEDVLEELEGLRGYGNSTYEDVVTRAAELANEIRELLGGDE